MLIRRLRNNYGNSEYEVEHDLRILRGCCWDEMLGAVARVALNGWQLPLSPIWVVEAEHGYSIEYELRLTPVESGWWVIEKGDAFTSRLTFDEMLGFVASFTLTGKTLFSGFRTYEQRKREPHSGLNRPVAALLS